MQIPEEEAFVLIRDITKTSPFIDREEVEYLIDREGKTYLDGVGGPIVACIGHGVQEIADAIYGRGRRRVKG